jgi:hypothetical protein
MDIAAAFEPIAINHAARPDPGDDDTFEPTAPPPDAEPPAANSKLGRYSQRWAYLGPDGSLQGYQCRFETATGKEFRPLRYGVRRGRAEWHWKG